MWELPPSIYKSTPDSNSHLENIPAALTLRQSGQPLTGKDF